MELHVTLGFLLVSAFNILCTSGREWPEPFSTAARDRVAFTVGILLAALVVLMAVVRDWQMSWAFVATYALLALDVGWIGFHRART